MAPRKIALITGSGKRRVGWYVADALAGRGYGLVIHYNTSAADAAASVEHFRGRGAEVMTYQADLADETAAKAMVGATLGRFGRIDVLVNCASIWQAKRLEDVMAADVRRNFDVNVLGTFLCCQHAGLAMVKQAEGGCIVNFGDWAEARPYLDYAAYFASKGGVPALTRCLAVELGTRNPRVRVNCIMPGPVLFQPDLPQTEKQQSVRATLTQTAGTPEPIAQAVLYLIDNNFVTGSSLVVDGGRTVYAGGN
jgi:pteridine reductase